MTIPAVTAIYDIATFDPNVRIQKEQPIEYRCISCPFHGDLSAGVEHAVKNQFIVREPEHE
jgi:hypothetical protein